MKNKALFLLIVLLVNIWYDKSLAFSGSASASSSLYYIEASISQCRLVLYEKQDGNIKILREYQVATAKRGLGEFPLGKGNVTKIELNPVWRPTTTTRAFFNAKKGIDLPLIVPFGHALNYMGAFKIYLSHVTSKGDVYRIHGNNNPSQIGQRVTGGCIRMYNDEGVGLAKLITVGVEVNIIY